MPLDAPRSLRRLARSPWRVAALGAALASGCATPDVPPRAAVAAKPSATHDPATLESAAFAPSSAVPSSAASSAAPPRVAPTPAPDPLAELATIAADPAPASLTLDTHYVVSNEDQPQAFYEAVRDRGGAFVGVGAEQSQLFGTWARAEVLYLLDFDDWVVTINAIHGLVLEHAHAPAEVIELWSEAHASEVERWIDLGTPDPGLREHRKEVFRRGRPKVEHRLKMVEHWLSVAKIPWFGSDATELAWLQRLWREGRVRPIRGDLTASGALATFGALARRSGWVVRAVYMSNAEQYFAYGDGSFRDNLRALPLDERSVILHTQAKDPTHYNYLWQDAGAYVEWTAHTKDLGTMILEARLPLHGKLANGAWLITRPTSPPAPPPP